MKTKKEIMLRRNRLIFMIESAADFSVYINNNKKHSMLIELEFLNWVLDVNKKDKLDSLVSYPIKEGSPKYRIMKELNDYRTVNQLVANLGLEQPNISKYLKELIFVGLVERAGFGKSNLPYKYIKVGVEDADN